MNIATRIFEICQDYDISDRKLSIEAGLSEGYISKTRSYDREIGSEKVEKIYHTLNRLIKTKINPEWFLTGSGSKFLSSYMLDEKGKMIVNENTALTTFEYKLLNALDNIQVQKKLKEILNEE